MLSELKVMQILTMLEAQMTTSEELKIVKECKEKLKNLPPDDLQGEEWRDIVGYEGYYQISNKGRVKSFHYGRSYFLKTKINSRGYEGVVLSRKGVEKNFSIHVLVAEAFIPNPENKRTVNHKDADKLNNCVENLEWATHRENAIHAWQNGLYSLRKGIENPLAKLSTDSVRYIRKNYKARDKDFGQQALAKKFNVNIKTIRNVLLRQTYTNIL